MAGYFYAMHQLLRCKPVLEVTISSGVFVYLKLGTKDHGVTDIIKDELHWKQKYAVARCVFYALLCLRVADSQKPAMDKLYYFSRRTTDFVERSIASLNNTAVFSEVAPDGGG